MALCKPKCFSEYYIFQWVHWPFAANNLIVTAMAVERYILICTPFKAEQLLNKKARKRNYTIITVAVLFLIVYRYLDAIIASLVVHGSLVGVGYYTLQQLSFNREVKSYPRLISIKPLLKF